MTFIVATNFVASRPPECRPTGTPHARANYVWREKEVLIFLKFGMFEISMILSRRRDTLYHVCVIVSRRRDLTLTDLL